MKPNLNIFPIDPDNYMKVNKIESNHYEVFLDEPISEPSNYRDLISAIFNASDLDTFTIYFNTEGGHLNTTLAIIEGLKNTNAEVTGVLMGETHSGGSLIAMYCHNLAVLDSAEMMIHTANYGSVGTVGNVKAHTEFTTRQVEKLLEESYEGFLSKDEIEHVKLGVEVWLDADQIRQRIEKRVVILKKKIETNKLNDEKAAKNAKKSKKSVK